MTTTTAKPSEGAKTLQERLHILLSRLSATIDLIKTWPESDGDDASIHVETSSKLIASIREVISALEHVEGIVKADDVLRKALQDCPIPIDLLELLDHANGLNPDCFTRGLLLESLGQLAGLKRRKLALEMLGKAVQSGLDETDDNKRGSGGGGGGGDKKKRGRSPTGQETTAEKTNSNASEPAAKRIKT